MDKITALDNTTEDANPTANVNNLNDLIKPDERSVPEATINVSTFHAATFTSKTEETINTLAKSEPQLISNNSIAHQQLHENVQESKITENQGRNKALDNCNQGTKSTPSVSSNTETIISDSLSNLLVYGSSSEDWEDGSSSESESDSEDENESNLIVKDAAAGKYREKNRASSDTDSSSSESSYAEFAFEAKSKKAETTKKNVRADGELGLDDLPPVADLSKLNINVKSEQCIRMGKVITIVDRLVMVQSLPNMPAYDLDTLLFLNEGKEPLGHIYDVIGQVTSPIYVIRFNSTQEIESKGIIVGLAVYSAPNTEHTQYVFLKELMKVKGSDASWQGDNEMPPEFLDFSDDEAEYRFSKQNLNEQDTYDKKRKRNSLEKHKLFETAMNLRNKVDTAHYKTRDNSEPTPKRPVPVLKKQPPVYYPITNPMQQQQCSTSASFTGIPQPRFSAPNPHNFGYLNMGSTLFPMPSPYVGPFPPFPLNPPPFPPPTFCPIIPPLPAIPHVLPQPPAPGTFIGSMGPIPINIQMKQTVSKPKSPNMQHTGGVVPKTQSAMSKPKLYVSPPHEYRPAYPPNLGLPKAVVPSFAMSPPQNIPINMPPPFGLPMSPWSYNIARPPHTNRGFQYHRNSGQQFRKQ